MGMIIGLLFGIITGVFINRNGKVTIEVKDKVNTMIAKFKK